MYAFFKQNIPMEMQFSDLTILDVKTQYVAVIYILLYKNNDQDIVFIKKSGNNL